MSEPLDDESQTQYLNVLVTTGNKIKATSEFFGKQYVWFVSPSGEWFLERLPKETDA